MMAVSFNSITTGGTGTAYPSGAPPFFSGIHVAQSLVVFVVLCRLLFCPFFFGHCIAYPSNYGPRYISLLFSNFSY